MDLLDKVAVITGSARGIGKAITVKLLEAGARVCISNTNRNKGETTLKDLGKRFGNSNVCYVQCDVTNEEEIKSLFDKAEQYFDVECVDILVNNAGVNVNLGWKTCMEVNLMGVFNVTMTAVERMKKASKPCQILHNSSIAGLAAGVPDGFGDKLTPYTVAKLGVVTLTRSMALGPKSNIMHKAFCPDGTDTDLVAEAGKGLDPEAMKEYQKMTGGLMTSEFVAEGFMKLLTECSTGSVMLIQKDSPYILMPDFNKPLVLAMPYLSKMIGKMSSTDMVNGTHLTMVIILVILMFCAMLLAVF